MRQEEKYRSAVIADGRASLRWAELLGEVIRARPDQTSRGGFYIDECQIIRWLESKSCGEDARKRVPPQARIFLQSPKENGKH
jgi:hypothetical protein